MKIKVYFKINELPQRVMLPIQIHGDKIVEVVTGGEDLSGCDALFTTNKSLSLGVRTADCAPVCFSDGERIGIAHIGWRGLCIGLIEKMLAHFNVDKLEVFVGPFNHSFEIQRDFCHEQIQAKFGDKFFVEKEGVIQFLFKDVIMSLLPSDAAFNPRNTFLDESLPSFRRDKTSERIVTAISFN